MRSPRSAYDKHNRPGWLLLDLPKNYKWSLQQVNLVERMTDVGQGVLSGRYTGVRHQAASGGLCYGACQANPKMNSHVIVFSNEKPHEGFGPREVWLLKPGAPDDEPEWECPCGWQWWQHLCQGVAAVLGTRSSTLMTRSQQRKPR